MLLSKNKHPSALTLIVLSTAIGGTNAVALKIAVDTMDPLLFSSLRFLFMGIVLLLFIKSFRFLRNRKLLLKLSINSLLLLGFIVFFSLGVEESTALKASLLSLITPIVVYLFSVALLHEPVIKRVVAGGVLALMGSLLLIGLPTIMGQQLEPGDILLLISFVSLAAMIVHTKHLYKWVTPNQILTTRFILSGGVLLSYVLLASDWSTLPTGDLTAWILLLYSIVITGVIANIVYYRALRNVRMEDAAPVFYLDPAVGALAAAWLLGERLDIGAMVGVTIIVIGVLLSHPHHVRLFHHYHVHVPHPWLDFFRRIVGIVRRTR